MASSKSSMSYQELHELTRRAEQHLAPGSETTFYGEFVEEMIRLGGPRWRESDEQVPTDVADHWVGHYDVPLSPEL
jgi:hypothetical protein